MKQNSLRAGLAVIALIAAALVLYFRAMPPAPLYGPYTAADLVTHTNYESADVPTVIRSNLETMRMISQLGLPRTVERVSSEPAYTLNSAECHNAMHVVGREAYDLMGLKAFEECTTACFSGCYHGVLQRLSAESSSAELVNEIQEFCGARGTVFERDQCFHGGGHGFLLYTRYDIGKAVDFCRMLNTDAARYSCYAGVFMENITGNTDALTDANPMRMSDADPQFPCTMFNNDESVLKSCYQYQPSRFLDLNGMDFAKAAAECLQAPVAARGECFKRLGQQSGTDVPDPSEATERFCGTVPSEYYGDCIRGGLRQAIIFPGLDPDGGPASFCQNLASTKARGVCYTEYGKELKDMFLDKAIRLHICSLFDSPYDTACAIIQ